MSYTHVYLTPYQHLDRPYIYTRCRRAEDNELIIDATLDYVIQAATEQNYIIDNAQEVLEFLVAKDLLGEFK